MASTPKTQTKQSIIVLNRSIINYKQSVQYFSQDLNRIVAQIDSSIRGERCFVTTFPELKKAVSLATDGACTDRKSFARAAIVGKRFDLSFHQSPNN